MKTFLFVEKNASDDVFTFKKYIRFLSNMCFEGMLYPRKSGIKFECLVLRGVSAKHGAIAENRSVELKISRVCFSHSPIFLYFLTISDFLCVFYF